MQAARGNESVAAIIAFATDDANRIALRIIPQNVFRHRAAGVFHQGERWHFIFGSGDAIDIAHFGGADDLHASGAALAAAAVASRRAMPPGSPSTSR